MKTRTLLALAALSIHQFLGPSAVASAPTPALRANPLYQQTTAPHATPDATITIDTTTPLLKSDLTFGVTHTHYLWERGNPDAVARAKNLLRSLGGFQNTFIQSWGAKPIKTDIRGNPANLDTSLTPRVNLVTSLGEGVITFCSAPGWMKPVGTGNPDDPAGDNKPDEAPLPQYETAFATLCASIAAKYTNVRYFQVWSEFKGMWKKDGGWDYERYTRLYNKVYTAVKKVRPDARIGGFYQVFGGDGTADILGTKGPADQVGKPFPKETRDGMKYFLKNAAGIDFFCVDRRAIGWRNPGHGTYTDLQTMKLTPVWETFMREVIKELAAFPKYSGIPIMYSEYYADLSGYNNRSHGPVGKVTGGATFEQYAAAEYASIYNHVLRGGQGRTTWMLLWMQDAETIPFNVLFTDTKNPAGGQPTPLYWVKKVYKDWLANAALVKAISTTPDVEVIASSEAVLVINKKNVAVKVNINGRGITLPAFGVGLVGKH